MRHFARHAARPTASATLLLAATLFFAAPAAAQTLNIGTTGTTSDAPFYIADKRGYFKAEGLTVKFIGFDSAAKMMAPLGTGELDVATGATSAGLYNAVKRDIKLRIVADKAKNSKGYGFQAIMVRKDLIDSGKVKTPADLKGQKFAISALGNSESFLVDEMLKKAGLKPDDIDRVYLGFPQHVAAFTNGGIGASLTSEPAVANIVKAGVGVRFMGADEIYPEFQTAVTFYSEVFVKKSPEAALKFMKAFLRGARDYNDALQDGKLTGPGADAVIAILTESTNIKDPAVYRAVVSHFVDPDGAPDTASLKRTWQYFKDTNQIDGSVTVDQVLDLSFAQKAAAELGPYKKKSGSN